MAVAHIADETVHVLCVQRSKGISWIEEAHTLDQKAFDHFLAHVRISNFVVVASFRDFFADVFTIPAAKQKYERVILENEIRARYKRSAFEYMHAIIGEKTVEKKRLREVFAFAVDRAAINDIIGRLLSHGKTVSALYPDMFAIARLAGKQDQPTLCIMQSGPHKNMFMVRDRSVSFVRVAQAFDSSLGDLDVQNIVMTVNYCRQALRANIQCVNVIGQLCGGYGAQTQVPVTMTSFLHPALCRPVKGTHLAPDFIFPVAALACAPDMQINMVPRESRKTFFRVKIMRLLMVVFAMVAAFTLFQVGFSARDVRELWGNIEILRKNMTSLSLIVDQYHSKQAAFERYRPFVDAYRTAAQLPDAAGLLKQLSGAALDNISIDSITLRYSLPDAASGSAEPAGLEVQLSGLVRADSYAQIQNFYQKLLTSIKGLKDMHLAQQSLDVESKKFLITARQG